MEENLKEAGNVKRTKFYVCTHCGSFVQGNGEYQVFCCGKQLEPLKPEPADIGHSVNVSEIENDFYIEVKHEMIKKHYISFISYVAVDRVLTVRLYPEQDAAVRFPKMHGGKLYCFCTKHGLFEYQIF